MGWVAVITLLHHSAAVRVCEWMCGVCVCVCVCTPVCLVAILTA